MKSNITITRKNIGGPKSGDVIRLTIKDGRKKIGEIFEPCKLLGNAYKIAVTVAPGYGLHGTASTLEEAFKILNKFTYNKYDIKY